MILALETATPVCSVALETGAERIFEKRIEGRGVHSEHTFTFVRELLDRQNIEISDLDAVLFSKGPGSYTGLRIGAAAIKGFLFGREVPFFVLPTLLSYTAAVVETQKSGTIHAVIDARRSHLYRQKIKVLTKGNFTITPPAVEKISEIKEEISEGDMLIGTGWERLELDKPDKVKKYGTEAISAKNLIVAWRNPALRKYFSEENAEQFEPDYLTMAQINNSPFRG